MKSVALISSLVIGLALSLTGCSKPTETPQTSTQTQASADGAVNATSYDAVVGTGKGFTVGSMMSAQTVYVLFEPQCPHCARLWQASLPLHNKVKFIWMPVSFSAKSLPQAAALLTASNPLETMSAHEASLLAGKGGLSAPDNVSPELAQAIKNNAQLLTALGADSVPFVLTKNRSTGVLVSHNGALETGPLSQLLGID